MRLDQYDRLFAKVVLPPAWRFGLLDHNGVRLHRFPAEENAVPGGLGGTSSLRAAIEASDADEGMLPALGPDGVSLVYAFVKMRLSPQDAPYMTVVVGLPAISLSRVFALKVFPALSAMLVVLALALLIARFLGNMTLTLLVGR